MAPESWNWGGDGGTFVITVDSEKQSPTTLLRQHISNNTADQHWHDIAISLAPYSGETITITLATESGPDDDFTGDWAGWESPRIIWDNPDEKSNES